MGYDQDARRQVYELKFRPYPGLVVRCRKPGFEALELLTDAVLTLGDDLAGDGLAAVERIGAWSKLYQAFAGSLVSWNLTDRGHPVPATEQGVFAQDQAFLLELARSWYVIVVLRDETPAPRPASSDDEPTTSNIPGRADKEQELEHILADIPVRVNDPAPQPADTNQVA